MRRKHRNSPSTDSEEEESEETPQKRKKHDNRSLPSHIVDDIKDLMAVINKLLPEKYAMTPTISELPRELLQPRLSTETVLTKLEAFQAFCRSTVTAITLTRSLEPPSNLTTPENIRHGWFILRFVALS
jgi:hypothetical protein